MSRVLSADLVGLLLDSVFVEPAKATREVPTQRDGQNVDQDQESKWIQQHHCVVQERKCCRRGEEEKMWAGSE